MQEKYLHTLGNLTLTGYNSELSDRPFREKLTMKGGFRDSPLRLNHYLAELEHWNEEEIQKRAALLADQVLKIWPAPQLPEETLAKYRKTKAKAATVYTLDDHPALAGADPPALRRAPPARPEPRRRRARGGAQAVHRLQAARRNFVEVVPLASELKLYLDIAKRRARRPARPGTRRHHRRPLGHRQRRGAPEDGSTSSRT